MQSIKKSGLKAIFISSLVSMVLINTCTVYYNASDIKKTFLTSQKESDKVIRSIAKDRSEKRGMLNQLTANLTDSTLAPYPVLATKLAEMSALLKKLKQTSARLEELNTQFGELSKGHKKIESNSALWESYQSIKTDYDTRLEELQKLTETYNQVSNSFVTISNESKIAKIKVADLKKQVSAYMREIDKNVTELTKNIAVNQKRLEQSKRQGSSPSKLAAQSKSLDELNKILTVISAKRDELSVLVDQFEREVGDEPEIWSGPGLLTQTIIHDMTRLGAEIEKQGQEFNALAKHL